MARTRSLERAQNRSPELKPPGTKPIGDQFACALFPYQHRALELLMNRNPNWKKAEALRHLLDIGIRAAGLRDE